MLWQPARGDGLPGHPAAVGVDDVDAELLTTGALTGPGIQAAHLLPGPQVLPRALQHSQVSPDLTAATGQPGPDADHDIPGDPVQAVEMTRVAGPADPHPASPLNQLLRLAIAEPEDEPGPVTGHNGLHR